MTETPDRFDEPTTGSVDTLPPPPPVYAEPPHAHHRPNRLYQAAAWVAIVAGVIFIVGAVFFTGFALGRHSGGDGGWRHHRGDNSQFERRGGPPMMQFPMMPGPGGPGSGPGFAPGGPGGAGATATPAPRP